jgi:uncharacterized membrane protein
MKATIYLPKPPKLQCDANGNISFKQMDEYFRVLGQFPSQIRLQATGIGGKCGDELIIAAVAMGALLDEITGVLMTDVFKKIKSKEQEMMYKVREFLKEIDVFFQKKIIEIIIKIIGILGIPNPLEFPIPFLSGAQIPNDKGDIESFSPKVKDLFTKAGKAKCKLAMTYKIDKVKKFLGIDGKHDGKLGIKSPEHEAEEVWQKIVTWLKKTLEDFIFSAIEAIVKVLTKIPIIGPVLKKLLAAAIDPTITIEEAFKQLVEEYKKKINKAIEDVTSGRALENLANKLLNELIDKVLNFPIPIFGTLGDLIGFDLKDELKKSKIHSKENLWHRIEDQFDQAILKIRKFFHGGLIKKIHEIILKAPGWILKQFPIVKKIFNAVDKIVKFLSGQNPLTTCDVVNIILPPIFNLGELLVKLLPTDCVEVKFTKYGVEPAPA